MRARTEGYTLIELVVVVALVGIVAMLAVPSYRDYVLRAHRTEARAALLSLASAQEEFYLQCNTYTSVLEASGATSCAPARMAFPVVTETGRYQVRVTAADSVSWSASAIATAGSPQYEDGACRVLRLNAEGIRASSAADGRATDTTCWSR
jgi:type IV pilus assembly protein PilE